MGGSTFIQVWMVLSGYCEQFQRWGVSNQWECTARTFENFASNRISNKFQFDLLHTNCSHTQSDYNNYYTPATKHYTHTFLVKDWGLVIVSGLLVSGWLTDFFFFFFKPWTWMFVGQSAMFNWALKWIALVFITKGDQWEHIILSQ